jgi:hypothetical protein
VATMPARKVIMGLPWYGYDWQGTDAADLVYNDAIALAQRVGAQVAHDANGEAIFTYSGHSVYFQDASSYSKKIDAILAKHPDIGGFAHWRAGGEDPAIWSDVARLHNSSSSGVTPVTGTFVIAGPTALAAKPGQQSQVNFAITAINGWNGTANVTVQLIDSFPGSVSVTPSARVGAPAILTVIPSANAASGQYRVKISMTSGTIVSESTVTVQIEPSVNKRRSARH